ncbi:MAG: hypothetical protein JSS90_07390 [Bacteroidetes bacterium]|nr:hypothetical protein [Bacteroidota bacterium]
MMNKILRISGITISIIFAFLLIAWGLSIAFEDKIKSLVIEEINNNLQAPASVQKIQFSLIRHFPYATLSLEDVEIKGYPIAIKDKPLLKAQRIDLMLSIFSIFTNTIQLKKIEVVRAGLNIITTENREHNDDIFKPSKSEKSFTANFDKVILKTIKLVIDDRHSRFYFNNDIDKATLSGNFNDDTFNLNTDADFYIYSLLHDNMQYLEGKKTHLSGKAIIDTRGRHYTFDQTKIKIENLSLSAEGAINILANNTPSYKLKITSNKANAGELSTLLPSAWLSPQILNYKYSGNVYFETSIINTANKSQSPFIEIKFGTKKTDITPDRDIYALRNVSLEGYYSNHISNSKPYSVLKLSNIRATLEGKPLSADVYLENLKNPYMDITVNANMSVASLSRYLPNDFAENQKGTISFNGSVIGQMDKKETYRSKGTLLLTDIQFKLKKRPLVVNNLQGKIVLNDAEVLVEDLKIKAGKSDMTLNANISNFYNYIFRENQLLTVKGIAESEFLDLNELLATDSHSDSASVFDLPENLNFNASVHAANIQFRKFNASDFNGNIVIKNKILSAENVQFNAMEGNVTIDGQLNASQKDSLLISCNARINKLNVQKLFYETGDFGQATLTDKNIRGSVTSTVDFASVWDKNLHVNRDRIFTSADITIEDGELINFKPMLKLSRYVKGSDLQNVKFSTLKNTIQIRQQKILIPTMEIHSSAINITVNGEHTFANWVDYRIKLKLSQLLGRKVKQQNTEFGTIQEDASGGLNLYLTMKGPLDNPKFTLDRLGVEKNITKSVQEGRKDFIKTIKEEFSNKPKDNEKTEDSRKQKELQIETEDE